MVYHKKRAGMDGLFWASLTVIQCGLTAANPRSIVFGIVAADALGIGTCWFVCLLTAAGDERLEVSHALEAMMPFGSKELSGMAKELPIAAGWMYFLGILPGDCKGNQDHCSGSSINTNGVGRHRQERQVRRMTRDIENPL